MNSLVSHSEGCRLPFGCFLVFTNRHRFTRCVVSVLTATVVAIGLMSLVPAQAAPLGQAPRVESPHRFQLRAIQTLDWSAVRGATKYQVFVKQAAFNRDLPRNWRHLKTTRASRTRIYVPQGATREFGVRAVGARNGTRHRVTAIRSFGTVSRPARLSAVGRSPRWNTVRNGALYRNVAYQARRPGATLWLRGVQDSTSIRLVGEAGPRFGIVDVYVGRSFLKRVNFGQRRHNADRGVYVNARGQRTGTIRLVSRSWKPVRISAIGHNRTRTNATRTPPAPIANRAARSFTIKGAGWGHGVGLSQYGAKAMADAGRSPSQILQHYYRGTKLSTVADNRLTNVNVGYHRSSLSARLRGLTAGAEVRVCAMVSGRCAAMKSVTDKTGGSGTAGLIRVDRIRGDVRARVTDQTGKTRTLRGSTIRLRWSGTRYVGGDASVIRLDNGREYRHGQMVVNPDGSTRLNAVLRLQLQDEYLRGVAEMPSSWNMDALRAQAMIARTYALRTGAGNKGDCDCNLRDSVVHQAYSGWAKENEGRNAVYGKRWVSAVNSTDGRVLTYGGALAGTYYYSSSGGHTLNSQDVWSGKISYLRSVDDPWSLTSANPNRSWTTTYSQATMASLFGLRDIHKIDVTSKYAGGAARSVRATSSNGATRTISGKADYMRSRFGLKSAWMNSITENY